MSLDSARSGDGGQRSEKQSKRATLRSSLNTEETVVIFPPWEITFTPVLHCSIYFSDVFVEVACALLYDMVITCPVTPAASLQNATMLNKSSARIKQAWTDADTHTHTRVSKGKTRPRDLILVVKSANPFH